MNTELDIRECAFGKYITVYIQHCSRQEIDLQAQVGTNTPTSCCSSRAQNPPLGSRVPLVFTALGALCILIVGWLKTYSQGSVCLYMELLRSSSVRACVCVHVRLSFCPLRHQRGQQCSDSAASLASLFYNFCSPQASVPIQLVACGATFHTIDFSVPLT